MPDEQITLYSVVRIWLDRMQTEADRKLRKAREALRIERSAYTINEHAYSKHSSATIRWLILRLPKVWKEPHTVNAVAELDIIAAKTPRAKPVAAEVTSLADVLKEYDCGVDYSQERLVRDAETIARRLSAGIESEYRGQG